MVELEIGTWEITEISFLAPNYEKYQRKVLIDCNATSFYFQAISLITPSSLTLFFSGLKYGSLIDTRT